MIGQTTTRAMNRLEAQKGWSDLKDDGNLLEMVEAFKRAIYEVNDKKYRPDSLSRLKKHLMNFVQTKDMTLVRYNERFSEQVDVIHSFGGSVGGDILSIYQEIAVLYSVDMTIAGTFISKEQLEKAAEVTEDKALAALFVANLYENTYGEMRRELSNSFAQS